MGIAQSPKTVSDDLVFHFDAKNNRSYQGPVIANEFAVPTPAANGAVTFAIQGTGTFYRVPAGEVHGGYKVGADDVVYRYDLGGSGCHYHGNQTTIPSGYYATWQFEYYISKSIVDFPTVNYLANMENIGAGIGGAVTVDSPTIGAAGNWRSVRYTIGPATTTGTLRPLLYPGACNSSYLGSAGYILYKNPAVWYTPFIPSADLPYVSGSRSDSQSFVDSTGNATASASNLTYANNGSFSFNGSSDYIRFNNSTALDTQTPTVEVWVKTNSLNQNGFWFEKGTVNSQYALFQEGTSIRWRMNIGGITQLSATTASFMNTSDWFQIVGTYTSGTRKLYINGVEVASDSQTGTIATNSGGMTIGEYGGGAYRYNGSIDVVRVYNRALTAEEVAQNFNALRGRYGI